VENEAIKPKSDSPQVGAYSNRLNIEITFI